MDKVQTNACIQVKTNKKLELIQFKYKIIKLKIAKNVPKVAAKATKFTLFYHKRKSDHTYKMNPFCFRS